MPFFCLMTEINKNKQKAIRGKKHPADNSVRLSQETYAAKKTAEMNALLENAVLLPPR